MEREGRTAAVRRWDFELVHLAALRMLRALRGGAVGAYVGPSGPSVCWCFVLPLQCSAPGRLGGLFFASLLFTAFSKLLFVAENRPQKDFKLLARALWLKTDSQV